jgi:hypothetical protein
LHDGRYETIVGSDVARDGMFLELWDRPSNELALWAFFSDARDAETCCFGLPTFSGEERRATPPAAARRLATSHATANGHIASDRRCAADSCIRDARTLTNDNTRSKEI